MVLFGPIEIRPSTTAPLTLKAFADYFLIPYLISTLIAEDMNQDISDSIEIRKQSADVGNVLMALSVPPEGLLDTIFEENVRHRRDKMAVGSNIDHGAPEPCVSPRADIKEHTILVSVIRMH